MATYAGRQSRALNYDQCLLPGHRIQARDDYDWMRKGEYWSILRSEVPGRDSAGVRLFYLRGPLGQVQGRGLPFSFLAARFYRPLPLDPAPLPQ